MQVHRNKAYIRKRRKRWVRLEWRLL